MSDEEIASHLAQLVIIKAQASAQIACLARELSPGHVFFIDCTKVTSDEIKRLEAMIRSLVDEAFRSGRTGAHDRR